MRGGEYNIFIINEQYADVPAQTGDTEQSPTPIISIENLDNYIHDNKVSVKDLYLQISSMGNEKPDIVEGNDLPDFNPDDEYLQEIKSPIFYAVQKNINIKPDNRPSWILICNASASVSISSSISAPKET